MALKFDKPLSGNRRTAWDLWRSTQSFAFGFGCHGHGLLMIFENHSTVKLAERYAILFSKSRAFCCHRSSCLNKDEYRGQVRRVWPQVFLKRNRTNNRFLSTFGGMGLIEQQPERKTNDLGIFRNWTTLPVGWTLCCFPCTELSRENLLAISNNDGFPNPYMVDGKFTKAKMIQSSSGQTNRTGEHAVDTVLTN